MGSCHSHADAGRAAGPWLLDTSSGRTATVGSTRAHIRLSTPPPSIFRSLSFPPSLLLSLSLSLSLSLTLSVAHREEPEPCFSDAVQSHGSGVRLRELAEG